jgi:hypothetical protein
MYRIYLVYIISEVDTFFTHTWTWGNNRMFSRHLSKERVFSPWRTSWFKDISIKIHNFKNSKIFQLRYIILKIQRYDNKILKRTIHCHILKQTIDPYINTHSQSKQVSHKQFNIQSWQNTTREESAHLITYDKIANP